jgi:predicted flavoprotein YhiN
MNRKKVAVVGGGASGLTAAYFSAETCSVTVFEKQKKTGRKILVTGTADAISPTETSLKIQDNHRES